MTHLITAHGGSARPSAATANEVCTLHWDGVGPTPIPLSLAQRRAVRLLAQAGLLPTLPRREAS